MFWGLTGTGIALAAIGVPLLAAENTSGGWRALGIALVAVGGILVLAAPVMLVVRRRGHKSASAPVTVTAGRDAVGRDGYNAKRDINIVGAASSDEGSSGAVRLRQVRDEIRHILRRCDQMEDHAKEWGTIRPVKGHTAYQQLPAERWNTYGASLQLPEADHEAINNAYEMANDFNVEMEHPPQVFGQPDPDLASLRCAFEHALDLLPAPGDPVARESA